MYLSDKFCCTDIFGLFVCLKLFCVEMLSDYGNFSNFSLQFCFIYSKAILLIAYMFRISISSW